jgi:hypothetical protein
MINDHDLAVFLLVVSCTLLTTTIGLAILWVRARERSLRARFERPSSSELDASRLEQVSSAVDAIAVEVERIGEGQRFVTKLLSERVASSPRASERVVTPH